MTEQAKAKAKTKSTTNRCYAGDPKMPIATGPAPAATAKPAKPRKTKISRVIALLERDQGATLNEMVKATGWLPHTTRAALTGLKKKGHTIERGKRDDVTCYRIVRTA